MAKLHFIDQHNMVTTLSKVKESEGFHEILDFLRESHIACALTVKPKIFIEQIKQFWVNASINEVEREKQIKATIYGKPIVITEATIRTHLHLNDAEGIFSLPNETLFGELKNMGNEGHLDKFTFYKELFSPQWKFLIHTIQQRLSQKRTSWNEFSSTIATAIVCLFTSQRFNVFKNDHEWNAFQSGY